MKTLTLDKYMRNACEGRTPNVTFLQLLEIEKNALVPNDLSIFKMIKASLDNDSVLNDLFDSLLDMNPTFELINRCGSRLVTKRMMYIINYNEESGNTITYVDYSIGLIHVSNLIINKYVHGWEKMYGALLTNYKPLENYAMKEKRSPKLDTEVKIAEKTDFHQESKASGKVHGFNSLEAVPSTETNGESDSSTTKLNTENGSKTELRGTDELERNGNIGVTTSQQMLESEMLLRTKWKMYEIIYKDIANEITLNVY